MEAPVYLQLFLLRNGESCLPQSLHGLFDCERAVCVVQRGVRVEAEPNRDTLARAGISCSCVCPLAPPPLPS